MAVADWQYGVESARHAGFRLALAGIRWHSDLRGRDFGGTHGDGLCVRQTRVNIAGYYECLGV